MRAAKFRIWWPLFLMFALTVFAQNNLVVKSQQQVGNWNVTVAINVWNDEEFTLAVLQDRSGQGELGLICVGQSPRFIVETKFAVLDEHPRGAYRFGNAEAVGVRWLMTNGRAFSPTFVLDEEGSFDLDRSMDDSLFYQKLLNANPPIYILGVENISGEMNTLIFDLEGTRELSNYMPCLKAASK